MSVSLWFANSGLQTLSGGAETTFEIAPSMANKRIIMQRLWMTVYDPLDPASLTSAIIEMQDGALNINLRTRLQAGLYQAFLGPIWTTEPGRSLQIHWTGTVLDELIWTVAYQYGEASP
jgi:hypothetical protein